MIENTIVTAEKENPELDGSGFLCSATNETNKIPSIIADSSILDNKEFAMTSGYIRIPRSLLTDPLWETLSLKHQMIFMKILELACYKPRKFDDHGHIIDLEIGQICISERELKSKCHPQISRIDIQRSYVKLILVGFLRQEVSHKKSVLTITHKDTYDLIKKASEPRNEPNLSQTRAKLEPETNKGKKVKKEKDTSLKVSNETNEKISVFSNEVQEIGKKLIEIMKLTNSEFEIPNQKMLKVYDSIDKIIRIDKKTPELILKVFTWAISDEFWYPLMFKPDPAAFLRKHFLQLVARMISKPAKKKAIDSLVVHGEIYSGWKAEVEGDKLSFVIQNGQALPKIFKRNDSNFRDNFIDFANKIGVPYEL